VFRSIKIPHDVQDFEGKREGRSFRHNVSAKEKKEAKYSKH
jgi:hypothetical protein